MNLGGSAARTLAVAKKVLRTLRNDKRSLALMIVAPMLAVMVFGFAFGSEITNVPVGIVNDDQGPLAGEIIARLDRETLDVRTYDSWDAARAAVRDGTLRASYHFPTDFTTAASPGAGYPPQPPKGTEIDAYVDGSNAQMAAAAARALQEAIQQTFADRGSQSPVSVAHEAAYADGADNMDYFVPGIMGFAALMFTMMLTLLAFVGERTSGTLTRLLMTPVREWEIVTGYALAFAVVGILQGAILLGVAIFVMDALVVGPMWLAFLVMALTALDALCLGILLSAAAKREAQAIQMMPLVLFPTMILSGIFLPVESLPAWLQPVAWAIPPTHSVAALRDVMLRGWGLADVWVSLLVLAGFAVIFLGLATMGLRRQRA